MDVDREVSEIKGVGPALSEKFAKIGVNSIGDLLEYFPRVYSDYSDATTINKIRPGLVTLVVRFDNIKTRRVRRGLHITESEAYDGTGRVKVVWFNQPYRAGAIKSNEKYTVHGKFELKSSRLQIINPSVELTKDIKTDQTIMPTYSERVGLKNHNIKKAIANMLGSKPNIIDSLPQEIVKTYKLMGLTLAYNEIHVPTTANNLDSAKRRFAFEELFIIMLASGLIKKDNKKIPATPVKFREASAKEFVAELPFDLTDSQRRVIWKTYQDMQLDVPMNRLIEGDVGSGKTVVATMAALMALEAGMQVAIIAPTEILARQHYATVRELLAHTNYANATSLAVGSLTKKQKIDFRQDISNGSAKFLVGTHALLQQDIDWQNLGLVIIDEQHRFGVDQRQALHTKSGKMPHVLCMTATPIPRSLGLVVYGELDISILDKPPATRAGSETSLVSPNSVAQMYDAIKTQLDVGRQAYVVCPLVKESDVLEASSAEETYKSLNQKEYKKYKVGLLHGKMKPADKDSMMQLFKDKKLDVLICTTVIEVGVDVPNATEMVILNADRFGLAQLHQLRGRVGRGAKKGHCYLVMSDSKKPSRRMQVVANTSDGFKLAEYDLELRGPGAIYGTRQHGELDLRHVTLGDHKLIAEVRIAVNEFMNIDGNMVKYPQLADKLQRTLQLTYLN